MNRISYTDVRWFVYCHDIGALIDCMELCEMETRTDYWEVRITLAMLVSLVTLASLGNLVTSFSLASLASLATSVTIIQVVGYDDGKDVLKATLNRVKKGRVDMQEGRGKRKPVNFDRGVKHCQVGFEVGQSTDLLATSLQLCPRSSAWSPA